MWRGRSPLLWSFLGLRCKDLTKGLNQLEERLKSLCMRIMHRNLRLKHPIFSRNQQLTNPLLHRISCSSFDLLKAATTLNQTAQSMHAQSERDSQLQPVVHRACIMCC
eukprot:3441060-Rhodomonas_salina.1